MSENEPQKPSPAESEAGRLMGAQGWPVTVKLRCPVEFGKETIEELVFQKGTFGVLNGLGLRVDETPTFDQLIAIASRLSGKPLKVIANLDPDDCEEVFAVALGFFNRCRGAGRLLLGA